eukprot:273448-Alexandrium_andersonii.AAC.1
MPLVLVLLATPLAGAAGCEASLCHALLSPAGAPGHHPGQPSQPLLLGHVGVECPDVDPRGSPSS